MKVVVLNRTTEKLLITFDGKTAIFENAEEAFFFIKDFGKGHFLILNFKP